MIKKMSDGWWEHEYDWKRPNNDLFKDLPQYHFDRDEMRKVFDGEFELWLLEHMNAYGDEFFITNHQDEVYIIHFPSGTIVNWYKHVGRTNTCNKNLTIEDLNTFKKMLLADFLYEEVNNDDS